MVDLPPDSFDCEVCGRTVARKAVVRREPTGPLDPTKWQTFCCPDCGNRLETVFVGTE